MKNPNKSNDILILLSGNLSKYNELNEIDRKSVKNKYRRKGVFCLLSLIAISFGLYHFLSHFGHSWIVSIVIVACSFGIYLTEIDISQKHAESTKKENRKNIIQLIPRILFAVTTSTISTLGVVMFFFGADAFHHYKQEILADKQEVWIEKFRQFEAYDSLKRSIKVLESAAFSEASGRIDTFYDPLSPKNAIITSGVVTEGRLTRRIDDMINERKIELGKFDAEEIENKRTELLKLKSEELEELDISSLGYFNGLLLVFNYLFDDFIKGLFFCLIGIFIVAVETQGIFSLLFSNEDAIKLKAKEMRVEAKKRIAIIDSEIDASTKYSNSEKGVNDAMQLLEEDMREYRLERNKDNKRTLEHTRRKKKSNGNGDENHSNLGVHNKFDQDEA